jgi:hypothetical protein
LRWEFESPLTERQNKSVSGFDALYTQPIEAAAQANYTALNDAFLKANVSQINVKGGVLFAGKDTGSGLYNTPKSGFLPRLAAAYSWNDKTVLRGGFGLYQGFLGERRGDVIQTGYSLTTTVATTTGPNGAPLPVSISTPFLNTTILEPTGNSLGKQTGLGQNISFFNQDPKVSKQARWSFGVQRELWGGWVLDAEYVGNRGYDIEITRNLNAVPLKYLNTDNSRTTAMQNNNTTLTGTVANPFRGGLIPNASGTIARSGLLVPFPEFGMINSTNNDGKSWYNSGQLTVNKRFSNGYGLQFSYTRSKWTQQIEYLNAADPTPTKMISDQDVPNRFSMSGFYELPFGKGKMFLSNANKLVDTILGGWQIDGTYTYQSGFPIAFGSFNATNGTTTGDLFYVGGNISLPKDQRTPEHWFNTAAFISLAGATPTCEAFPTGNANCATPVNHLRTLPFRFADVRSDPINNADLGLRKDVPLNETMKIQLRVEFINAFNHPLLNTGTAGIVVTPSNTTFGQVSASNQQNYARRAQLSAKFIF